MLRSVLLACAAAAGAIVFGIGCAAPSGSGEPREAAGVPQLDQSEMMALIAELAAPGEHHRHLDPLAGEFDATTTHWLAPDAEPVTYMGRIDSRWILGGRFLLGDFRGEISGLPFEGISLFGYDNAKERYVATWADTMGTVLLPVSEGTCSEDGTVITMHRVTSDPVTGRSVSMRDVTTILGPDEHMYEMFLPGPDGKEFRTVEVRYTRVR